MRNFLFIIGLLFCLNATAFAYLRIVSLAPSVTESLYELGMENSVVGITIYCPKGNTKKEIIGTLLEPDLEKIVMLKPDLIISTKEGNNKAAVEKLSRLGFNVYVMETSQNFIEICSNFYNLGKKVGKVSEASEIIDKANESVNADLAKINNDGVKKVFWEIGAKPLYTAGRQSFANDYNRYTKTENIYGDTDMRYFAVNAEDVLERNPDIIILVNMGDISVEELVNWRKYKSVNAVKNAKVFMLDVNELFTPTPSAFAKGVSILSKKIYPEIFVDKK